MIYLDNASTTQVDDQVMDEMLMFMHHYYGNPGSAHFMGRQAKQEIDLARSKVAKLVNCDPKNLIFTSGGTESNNAAAKIMETMIDITDATIPCEAYEKNRRILYIGVPETEHDSVIRSFGRLNGKVMDNFIMNTKTTIRIVPIETEEYGKITIESVKTLYSIYKEKLIGIVTMFVNNETGYMNDVYDIGEFCKEKSILYHVDCVQALGDEDVSLKDMNCTTASFSSHKINGPKGVGALYVNPDIMEALIACSDDCALIVGGHSQECGLRGGTENVPGIVGFGKACELMYQEMQEQSMISKMFSYRCLFIRKFSDLMDKIGQEVKFGGDGKIVTVSLPGIDAQTLVLTAGYTVCVSAGSACRANNTDPSKALIAVGLTPEEAMCTIRVSFSRLTTQEEVKQGVYALAREVEKLKNMGGC